MESWVLLSLCPALSHTAGVTACTANPCSQMIPAPQSLSPNHYAGTSPLDEKEIEQKLTRVLEEALGLVGRRILRYGAKACGCWLSVERSYSAISLAPVEGLGETGLDQGLSD